MSLDAALTFQIHISVSEYDTSVLWLVKMFINTLTPLTFHTESYHVRWMSCRGV